MRFKKFCRSDFPGKELARRPAFPDLRKIGFTYDAGVVAKVKMKIFRGKNLAGAAKRIPGPETKRL